jgi:CheY-like chemotaxis protein
MTQPNLVYLIDDDSFLLDMYALKFKECGLPVEAITDATVALQKIRDGAKPDIIIVDIIMPGMTGFDFLEALQKEGLAQGARLVVLSNQGQQEDIDHATKLGATGYIIKASAIPSEVCEKVLAISNAANPG